MKWYKKRFFLPKAGWTYASDGWLKIHISQEEVCTFMKHRVKLASWRVSTSLLWVMGQSSSNVISYPCEGQLSVVGPEETKSHQTSTMWVPRVLYIFITLCQDALSYLHSDIWYQWDVEMREEMYGAELVKWLHTTHHDADGSKTEPGSSKLGLFSQMKFGLSFHKCCISISIFLTRLSVYLCIHPSSYILILKWKQNCKKNKHNNNN